MFQRFLKALEMSGDISFWGRTYVTARAVSGDRLRSRQCNGEGLPAFSANLKR